MKLITPQIYPPIASQVISSKIYQRMLHEQLLPVITQALGLLHFHKELRQVTRNATRLGMNPQIDPSNDNSITISVNASVTATAAFAFSRRLVENITSSEIAIDNGNSVREWHIFFDTLSEFLTNLDPEHKGVCPNCLWTTLETLANSGRAPILKPYFSISNQSYPGPHLPEENCCKINLLTAKSVTYKSGQHSSEEHLEDIFVRTSLARRLLRAAMLSFVPLLVFAVVSHIPSSVSWTLKNVFKVHPEQVMSLEGEATPNSPSNTPPFTVASNRMPLKRHETDNTKPVSHRKISDPPPKAAQLETNASAAGEVSTPKETSMESATPSGSFRRNRSPGGGALPIGGRPPVGRTDNNNGRALPGRGRPGQNTESPMGDGGALPGRGRSRAETNSTASAANDALALPRRSGSNSDKPTSQKTESPSEFQARPVVNPAECKSISIGLHKLGIRRVQRSYTQSCSWKVGQDDIVIKIKGDHLYAAPPQNCEHWSRILSNFENWRCEVH